MSFLGDGHYDQGSSSEKNAFKKIGVKLSWWGTGDKDKDKDKGVRVSGADAETKIDIGRQL